MTPMPAQESRTTPETGHSPIAIDQPDPFMIDQERIEIDESDDDIEFVMETSKLILTDPQSRAIAEDEPTSKAGQKIAFMQNKAPINFFTHEPTFAGWLNGLKREMSKDDAHTVILNALTRPHLVLGTVAGDSDNRKVGHVKASVGTILGTSPPPITVYPATSWFYIECGGEKQANDLLSAKIVWNDAAKAFVVFRKPRVKPFSSKAIEVLGIMSQDHWDAALAALLLDGKAADLEVIKTYPQCWVEDNTERTIWVVRHSGNIQYMYPPSLRVHVEGDKPSHPSKFVYQKSPVCLICTGEDHHLALCSYKAYAEKEKAKAKDKRIRSETAMSRKAKGKQKERIPE